MHRKAFIRSHLVSITLVVVAKKFAEFHVHEPDARFIETVLIMNDSILAVWFNSWWAGFYIFCSQYFSSCVLIYHAIILVTNSFILINHKPELPETFTLQLDIAVEIETLQNDNTQAHTCQRTKTRISFSLHTFFPLSNVTFIQILNVNYMKY